DVVGRLIQRGQKSASHRLRFAAVLLEIENREATGIGVAKRFEKAKRSIAAAIVDEEEIDVMAGDCELTKGFDIEPSLFVVAGDDQSQARHAGRIVATIGQ